MTLAKVLGSWTSSLVEMRTIYHVGWWDGSVGWCAEKPLAHNNPQYRYSQTRWKLGCHLEPHTRLVFYLSLHKKNLLTKPHTLSGPPQSFPLPTRTHTHLCVTPMTAESVNSPHHRLSQGHACLLRSYTPQIETRKATLTPIPTHCAFLLTTIQSTINE